jgi:hypothetical protein
MWRTDTKSSFSPPWCGWSQASRRGRTVGLSYNFRPTESEEAAMIWYHREHPELMQTQLWTHESNETAMVRFEAPREVAKKKKVAESEVGPLHHHRLIVGQ